MHPINKYLITAILITMTSLAFADKPNQPGKPPACDTKPVPVVTKPVQVTLERCDEYQIRVITTRGNNSIDAETLGYCDLEQAQNALAQINTQPQIKMTKGMSIQQKALPLF